MQPELVVIDREQHVTRTRYERSPDSRHLRRSAGNARQVGVGVDEPAAERARRMRARMHATVARDARAQRDDPAIAQAAQHAPAQHERDDRMRVLDPLERFDRRAPAGLGMADDRELQLLE